MVILSFVIGVLVGVVAGAVLMSYPSDKFKSIPPLEFKHKEKVKVTSDFYGNFIGTIKRKVYNGDYWVEKPDGYTVRFKVSQLSKVD